MSEKTEPLREIKKTLQVVTLRLPEPLIEQLDRVTAQGGFSSRSALVRHLLERSLVGKVFEFEQAEKAGDHANVIRAIIDCKKFLDGIPADTVWSKQVVIYLGTLRELEKNLAAEPGESEDIAKDV